MEGRNVPACMRFQPSSWAILRPCVPLSPSAPDIRVRISLSSALSGLSALRLLWRQRHGRAAPCMSCTPHLASQALNRASRAGRLCQSSDLT